MNMKPRMKILPGSILSLALVTVFLGPVALGAATLAERAAAIDAPESSSRVSICATCTKWPTAGGGTWPDECRRGKLAVETLDQLTGGNWQPWFERYVYGTEIPSLSR